MCLFTYCPQGQHFFYDSFYVLMVVLVHVLLVPVFWGSAAWLVGLDEDGFCSFDVTATVRARWAGRLLLNSYSCNYVVRVRGIGLGSGSGLGVRVRS